MPPILIVGAGVIGRTIGLELQQAGLQVQLFDDERPLSGTPASAGLVYAPWLDKNQFATMQDIDCALELLDRHYGVSSFMVGDKQFHHVPTSKVLTGGKLPCRVATVKEVGDGVVHLSEPEQEPHVYLGTVIVCAGADSASLLGPLAQHVTLEAKAGTGFRFSGSIEPMVKVWAPYKQLVAFNEGPGEIWAGDGTSIDHRNYTPRHIEKSQERVREALGNEPKLLTSLTGYRAYRRKGGPWLAQVGQRTWVATAAHKSGTALAGLWADYFRRQLCR